MKKYLKILLVLFLVLLIGLVIVTFQNITNSKYVKIVRVGDMNNARANHGAILLNDGRILVFDGFKFIDERNDTIEVFDLKKAKFSLINKDINIIHEKPLLLKNGKVVFFQSNKTTIFEPATNKFLTTKGLIIPRNFFSATLLQNNKILIVGGWKSEERGFEYSAEIYNPDTDKFVLLQNKIKMPVKFQPPLPEYKTILLKDGRVLLFSERHNEIFPIQIFNPNNMQFSTIKDMNILRHHFNTVLLKNGNVLFIGGYDKTGKIVRKTELYNPKNNSFSIATSMNYARQDFNSLLLNNGKVLITGGYDSNNKPVLYSEIYDPNSNIFNLFAMLNLSRKNPKTIQLNNEKVLVYGGYKGDHIVPGIEICDGKKCILEKQKIFERYFYNLIKLNDNACLFTGGGEMSDVQDSYIHTFKDSYLINFKK